MGFGGLGLLHQSNDAGEHRLAAYALRLDGQGACAVDGAAEHPVPLRLFHRHALAGEHGFIHRRASGQHPSVHRQAFAGMDQHPIPFGDLGCGDDPLHTVPQDGGSFGCQIHQQLDSRRGFSPRPGFQQLAQQHQGDHDSAAFKIQMGIPYNHIIQTVAVGGRGAQGHQDVHAGALVFQGQERPLIKPPAHHKLHRRGQNKLEPPVVQDMHQGGMRRGKHQHHHHQKGGRQDGGNHKQDGQAPGFPAAEGGLVLHHMIAGGLDGLFHPAAVSFSRVVGDLRPLIGIADRDGLDAVQTAQGMLHRPGAAHTGHAAYLQNYGFLHFARYPAAHTASTS